MTLSSGFRNISFREFARLSSGSFRVINESSQNSKILQHQLDSELLFSLFN